MRLPSARPTFTSSLLIASLAAAALAVTAPARGQDNATPPPPTVMPPSSRPAPPPPAPLAPVAATDSSGVMKLSDIREPDFSAATDVVFLADGYPADEQATFFAEAAAMAQHVDGDGGAASLRAHKKFNFHYVFVPSTDRGAAFKPGGPAGDTPFKSYLTPENMLRCDTAAADTAAAKYAPDVDVVVVVARFADGAPSGVYSMRANSDILGQGSRVRIPHDAPGAFVHELGHALFALGDEYDGRDAPMTESDREAAGVFPNLTFEPTGARWAGIVAGAVEGGSEWNHGIWHPTATCRMNQCWDEDQGFCPVCVATMGSLPLAGPSSPTIVSPSGTLAAGDLVATIQPGPGGQPWDYYVSVRRSSGTYDELRGERVEPQLGPVGKVALGSLPAGDYTLWVESENPAGHSSWVTRDFSVTGVAPPALAPSSPPQTTPPTTTPPTTPRAASGIVQALTGL